MKVYIIKSVITEWDDSSYSPVGESCLEDVAYRNEDEAKRNAIIAEIKYYSEGFTSGDSVFSNIILDDTRGCALTWKEGPEFTEQVLFLVDSSFPVIFVDRNGVLSREELAKRSSLKGIEIENIGIDETVLLSDEFVEIYKQVLEKLDIVPMFEVTEIEIK